MKTLYLDCSMGAAGDMLTAALLELFENRGEIIREEDLIDALNHDVIAGAFLDVTKTEPLPADDPLWRAKNILITPHRAAYGDQMQRKMCALIARNVKHWLADEPLEDRIL